MSTENQATDFTSEDLSGMTLEQLEAQLASIADDDNESGASSNTENASENTVEVPAKTDESKVDTPAANANVDTDAKADGILTKDGKNIIPMSVLEAERQGRRDAENRAKDMQTEIDNLKAGKSNVTELDLLSEEELVALEEEMPELGKRTRAQQEQLVSMQQQEVETKKLSDEERVARSVQDVIDSIPALLHAQTSDQDAWLMLNQYDMQLKRDPAFKDLTLAERFQKSVDKYEAKFGSLIPNATANKETKEDVAKKAQEAIKNAESAKKPITSMSEIAGGSHVAVDEIAAIEGRSVLESEAMFAKMTPEQIDTYLNKHT